MLALEDKRSSDGASTHRESEDERAFLAGAADAGDKTPPPSTDDDRFFMPSDEEGEGGAPDCPGDGGSGGYHWGIDGHGDVDAPAAEVVEEALALPEPPPPEPAPQMPPALGIEAPVPRAATVRLPAEIFVELPDGVQLRFYRTSSTVKVWCNIQAHKVGRVPCTTRRTLRHLQKPDETLRPKRDRCMALLVAWAQCCGEDVSRNEHVHTFMPTRIERRRVRDKFRVDPAYAVMAPLLELERPPLAWEGEEPDEQT